MFLCHQANIQFTFVAICGDDFGEQLTVGACDGSLNPNEQLCCPSETTHGGSAVWKAYNGYCVPELECPDVQRAPPVWVPIPNGDDATFDLWESLVQLPGYCCDPLETAPQGSRSLCSSVTEKGCFINVESVDTTTPPPIKQWCEQTGVDENCVLELNSENPMTVCEEAQTCEEEKKAITLQQKATICTDKETTTQEYCFMSFKPGCTADLTNCTAETHNVFSDNPSETKIYCDEKGNDCVEISPTGLGLVNSYTSYHGPFCNLPESCQQEECYTKTIVVDQTAPLGQAGSLDGGLPEGCTTVEELHMVNEQWFVKNIVCDDKSYCKLPQSTSRLTTLCIPPKTSNGNDIIVTKGLNGERIQCFDDGAQNFGDYWCPQGFIYDEQDEICEFQTSVCDKGFEGNLQYGCNTPLSPSDDEYWGLYQKECFFNSTNVPSGMNVYDKACCFDAVFNNFQIWQNNLGNKYVKVY